MDMKAASDDELDTFPHIFLMADAPRNPSIVDEEFFVDPHNSVLDIPDIQQRREGRDPHIDSFGTMHSISLAPSDTTILQARLEAAVTDISVLAQMIQRRLPDLDALLPNFGWVSKEWIHTTLEQATQHYQADKRIPMRKHFRSRFPAANVQQLPEWYSIDTFISDVPASDDGVPGHGGCKLVQIYGGLDSELLSAYPMASESSLPDTLREFIHEYGAMAGLKSDIAKSATFFAIKDIFQMYLIKDKQLEPHYQHQNPIERRIQDVKRMIKGIMDRTGCPSSYWLLCVL